LHRNPAKQLKTRSMQFTSHIYLEPGDWTCEKALQDFYTYNLL